jgi:hypothetical protein
MIQKIKGFNFLSKIFRPLHIADHKVNKLYELFPQNLQLPELMPYNNPPEL